jgi:hypothetical protein
MLGVPVSPNLRLKIGPEFGFAYNDSTLNARQLQGVLTGEEKAENSNFSFTTGVSAALNYKYSKGLSVGLVAAFENEFDRPVADLTEANNDPSVVGSADDLKYSVGVRLIVRPTEYISDRRLKTNITRIGALPSGLPVYRYNYIWSAETYIGVMAQEALQFFPEVYDPFRSILLPNNLHHK